MYIMDEVIDDKKILCTRPKKYVKSNETAESTPKLNKKRSGARNNNFFLSKDQHALPPSWKDEVNGCCDKCLKYELTDIPPYKVLPSDQDVLQYSVTIKSYNTGLHQNCERKVATDVVLQWIFCNIYLKQLRTVTHDLHSMMMNIMH